MVARKNTETAAPKVDKEIVEDLSWLEDEDAQDEEAPLGVAELSAPELEPGSTVVYRDQFGGQVDGTVVAVEGSLLDIAYLVPNGGNPARATRVPYSRIALPNTWTEK